MKIVNLTAKSGKDKAYGYLKNLGYKILDGEELQAIELLKNISVF